MIAVHRPEGGRLLAYRRCCLTLQPPRLPLLILLIGSSLLLGATAADASPDFPVAAELQQLIEPLLTEHMERHHIPGAALAVVSGEDIVLAAGYGWADIQQKTPVVPEKTLFRAGSVSKLLTAAAVMQLVEQNTLDLDADINKYLDFDIPNRTLTGLAEPITLRHLLTHTPGFEDVLTGLFAVPPAPLMPLDTYLQQHRPERIFPPGEVLAYSNYGSALAGYIAARAANKPFSAYAAEHLFRPLGMASTTFEQPLPETLAANMARGYRYDGERFHEGAFEFIAMSPAGGLSTTVTDMAAFMIAHLQDGRYEGEQMLTPETVDRMHRQQHTHHPLLHGVTLGFFENEVNGRRVLEHNGATNLFFSHLFLVPEEQLGLYIVFNGGHDANAVLELPPRLFQNIMDAFFPGPGASVPEPPTDAAERTAQYRGEYRPTRIVYTGPEKFMGLLQSVRLDMTEAGSLAAHVMGQRVELVEIQPGVYQNRERSDSLPLTKVAFSRTPDGELLLAAGTMTFTKAPWYGTMSFIGLLLVSSVVLLTASMLGWLVTAILHLRRRIGSQTYRSARLTATGFSLIAVGFLLGMAYIFSHIDPSYGVPHIILGRSSLATDLIMALPWLLLPLGAAMLCFTLLAWFRRYWNAWARIHYTLVTAAALSLLWLLIYTNQIGA